MIKIDAESAVACGIGMLAGNSSEEEKNYLTQQILFKIMQEWCTMMTKGFGSVDATFYTRMHRQLLKAPSVAIFATGVVVIAATDPTEGLIFLKGLSQRFTTKLPVERLAEMGLTNGRPECEVEPVGIILGLLYSIWWQDRMQRAYSGGESLKSDGIALLTKILLTQIGYGGSAEQDRYSTCPTTCAEKLWKSEWQIPQELLTTVLLPGDSKDRRYQVQNMFLELSQKLIAEQAKDPLRDRPGRELPASKLIQALLEKLAFDSFNRAPLVQKLHAALAIG